MSLTFTDTATPAITRIYEALAPGRRQPLMAVLGREGERVYRAWFRGRQADSPNRMGWPRQNFWAKRIAASTAFAGADSTTAKIVISDPAINAKVHGGTWGAKQSKYLAIPLQAEVYGVRPKANTIPGLHFIPSKRGGNTVGWLAGPDNESLGGKPIFYWRLQRTVTVKADPRALPPAGEVMAALEARALQFFFRPAKSSPPA